MSDLHHLNLPGWTTTATAWRSDKLLVTAKFEGPTTCPSCGSTGPFGKDQRLPQKYTDLPFQGSPVELTVERQRLVCRCGARPMQDLPDIDTGTGATRTDSRRMTKRCRRVLEDELLSLSFEDIAVRYGISSRMAARMFDVVATRLNQGHRILAPARLGIDEKKIGGDYRTVIVDLTPGRTRILDILPDRREATIVEWWRSRLINAFEVKIVAMDRYDAFRRAVRSVSTAKIVFDRWHIGQTIAPALNMVAAKPAVRAWHAVWDLETRAEAERAWVRWEADLSDEVRPRFSKFLELLEDWHDEVLSYWDDRVTTAAVERYNGNLKQLISASRGGTFDVIRARGLFHKLKPNLDRFQCATCRGYFDATGIRITAIGKPDERRAMTMHMVCLKCAPYPAAPPQEPDMIWLSGECWGPEGGLGAS